MTENNEVVGADIEQGQAYLDSAGHNSQITMSNIEAVNTRQIPLKWSSSGDVQIARDAEVTKSQELLHAIQEAISMIDEFKSLIDETYAEFQATDDEGRAAMLSQNSQLDQFNEQHLVEFSDAAGATDYYAALRTYIQDGIKPLMA